jgi:hypothetical protein
VRSRLPAPAAARCSRPDGSRLARRPVPLREKHRPMAGDRFGKQALWRRRPSLGEFGRPPAGEANGRAATILRRSAMRSGALLAIRDSCGRHLVATLLSVLKPKGRHPGPSTGNREDPFSISVSGDGACRPGRG